MLWMNQFLVQCTCTINMVLGLPIAAADVRRQRLFACTPQKMMSLAMREGSMALALVN